MGERVTNPDIVQKLVEDVEDLNSNIVPQDITNTLTKATGVTIIGGGAFVIGKLVIINLRITSSSAIIRGEKPITGFPPPFDSSSNSVPCFSNQIETLFFINTNGEIQIFTNSTSDMKVNTVYQIGSCYVCR